MPYIDQNVSLALWCLTAWTAIVGGILALAFAIHAN